MENMAQLAPGQWLLTTPAAGPQELQQIHQAIANMGQRRAAPMLGINRRTLYRWLDAEAGQRDA